MSEQLFGIYIEDWIPPASIAVKTNSNSIYFLAPLNDEVKDVEKMAIKNLQKDCEVIIYE